MTKLEREHLDQARRLPRQIEQMLSDPIIRALMAADGVDPRELEALACSVAYRLTVQRFRRKRQGPRTPNVRTEAAVSSATRAGDRRKAEGGLAPKLGASTTACHACARPADFDAGSLLLSPAENRRSDALVSRPHHERG